MGAEAILLLAANALPFLAKYLGGGEATQKVADTVSAIATTVAGVADPKDAFAAIEANPSLKTEFHLQVMAKKLEFDDMVIKDIQNARERDVKLAQAGFRNTRANWLAASSFVLVIASLFIVIWSYEIDEFAKGVLTLILGRALGWVEQIFSFEFGTTKQSVAKDATIANLSK